MWPISLKRLPTPALEESIKELNNNVTYFEAIGNLKYLNYCYKTKYYLYNKLVVTSVGFTANKTLQNGQEFLNI